MKPILGFELVVIGFVSSKSCVQEDLPYGSGILQMLKMLAGEI